ncbi:hypothetical protein PAXRUDRAFT_828359 [Paxillus rubicundulus Ve08.2h10]|uniref:Magnesium transporter n=1 Tax=Paxillus rubicundulus Ve08.2h10 TaxID=930991 RepID=A0A0D0DAC9_9AGAM|nr:hypothetical protein PAXRUDRAFT_828359 [Paxillus rubicundulus Ve08.2h10]
MSMASLHKLSDTLAEEPHAEIDDIYRGDHPPPRPADVESFCSPPESSSSSSSSSGSFITGIGALAAVVEHAITRWARRNSSGSSSSTSSLSSKSHRSSVFTRSRHNRRRRQKPSSATLQSLASERDVAARIRARHESRRVPREFTLYLPPELNFGQSELSSPYPRYPTEHVCRSSSLPQVLNELESCLKKSSKLRRNKEKAQAMSSLSPLSVYQDHALPDSVKAPSRPASFTDLTALRPSRKGKQKEPTGVRLAVSPAPGTPPDIRRAPKAWWLDVANPTWDDMRSIGKLLHLHPLTLEDILQQDTREKLELFPKLGYHFIVFRAIESTAAGDRSHAERDLYQVDEGLVREAGVYLVVFREGICTFHFTDISGHTERVRNRVKLLQDSFHMSSDWIAHGLLDSIVDSFFPTLKEIEKEVAAIEALVFSNGNVVDDISMTSTVTVDDTHDPVEEDKSHAFDPLDEKRGDAGESLRTRFLPARPNRLPLFCRLKRKFASFMKKVGSFHRIHLQSSQTMTTTTLRRMARTRRLVTSLSRLLASKSEVISQIRKRFLTWLGRFGHNIYTDDLDIAIYMGDVQDHILTLQQALNHYEHLLSESHPAYLSQLRLSVSRGKKGTDKAILMLSLVSLGALVPGPIIGLFSMNIHAPRNSIDPPTPSGPYYWFGIVLVLVLLLQCAFLSLARYWWVGAKRRRNSKLS